MGPKPNMIDEKTLDKKLADLTKTLQKHFDDTYGARIKQIATNVEQITANVDRLDNFEQRIAELERKSILKDEKIAELERNSTQKDNDIRALRLENETLKSDLDDQVNRGMRNNLIIKGIPEEDKEDDEATRKIVCEALATLTTEYAADDIEDLLDRTHRGGKRQRNNQGPEPARPRNIYMNFISSFHVDHFMKAVRTEKPYFKLERQFSKPVTDRRNLAMLERRKLLTNKQIKSGYLEYPARLMVKSDGDENYRLHKDF